MWNSNPPIEEGIEIHLDYQCNGNLVTAVSRVIITKNNVVSGSTILITVWLNTSVSHPSFTLEVKAMSKQTSWQRRVPEENSMLITSASVKRRLSSEHLQSQNYRGMTTTCCPGSNRSFWWGFAPVITDWTVICTVNWSWHPRQLAPVVEKSRPWSMFYKDAPFTKPQEKTCGLSALPWRPNSTAASRSWRRRRHSSPERPWSCRLRTPRRRRRRLKIISRPTSYWITSAMTGHRKAEHRSVRNQ